MQSLNKNGVSITQTPGEEKFVKCRLGAFRGQIYYQYDYRHTDGELFSTVAQNPLVRVPQSAGRVPPQA